MKKVSDEYKQELLSAVAVQNVAFFGCAAHDVPVCVSEKRAGRARFFAPSGEPAPSALPGSVHHFPYHDVRAIRDDRSDIYFLDGRATKVLFIDFPGTAHYVLVRARLRVSWLVAAPGLLRRLHKGLLSFAGTLELPTRSGSARWFVFKHELQEVLNARLSISADIGTQGLFKWFDENGVHYVVMRFFGKLPALYREGGDLDLLVSDEDERKVKGYLNEHAGSIGVDVWTPSRATHNSITYYPPPLARKIIESAREGPAGSRIPAPYEALVGFAYHVLYHKGLFAGVPSTNKKLTVNPHPENDYTGELKRLAQEAGVDIDITLESLDDFLGKEGWRPKTDTLAKIAPRNAWVWHHHFAQDAGEHECGVSVFVMRKQAVEQGLLPQALTALEESGFLIVHTNIFDEATVARVRDHVRGGVWNDVSGAHAHYLPAAAILAIDTRAAQDAHIGSLVQQSTKVVKGALRKLFDTQGKVSMVHSSDNTQEAWEYVHWCFPGEEERLRALISQKQEELKPSMATRVIERIKKLPRLMQYRLLKLKSRLIGTVIKLVMR